MASWIFGATTIPDSEAPQYDSSFDEDQEDLFSEFQPIGNAAADSTILTYIGSKSKTARLHMWVTQSTLTSLRALKRTTFLLKTPFDATGQNWYLRRLESMRWTSSDPYADAGTPRFHVWVDLVGRV